MTVGENRRAWAVGLVYADRDTAAESYFDWTNVLGGLKGMPLLGIAEILSQTDHRAVARTLAGAPVRMFDVRLSNGRDYRDFLYMQNENRRWKVLVSPDGVGKIAYSASEMLRFYRSRVINRHWSKEVADSVEIIGAQLAVLGIK